MEKKVYDVIVIGGGQAGLSMGYFLRRSKIDFLILDDQKNAGGSWQQTWDSLKLFSPADYSSLSGWRMPKTAAEYPTKTEFISYLFNYELRYDFPIKRNTTVFNVEKENQLFKIESSEGVFYSRTLASATGTAKNPFIPAYPSQEKYTGIQMHSSEYKNSNDLIGKKVLIVGGGNSGAQLLAEVSKVADAKWVTLEEPHYLPDEIDGRYLFNEATQKYLGKADEQPNPNFSVSLSNVVMIESVREARSRGVLHAKRPFKEFYDEGVIWMDATKENFDAIIWCTGFRANLKHLEYLNIVENGKIDTIETRSKKEPNLWLIGYGNWTGFASATIYGVGKTARDAVKEIIVALSEN
ncbi:ArsO family NAD(P)H-dependent flavin-containing monooxygenase [Frigoriflavimonas asaccharolytica]|uniref:Cation diffusion facilitator CzcD-associated flavoprotein CzcO n=1 Tax=Frigoriflavimonas asaccharolytica TaxID=2735899 RepID=A0A8J8K9I8_9FLAO|nr:ArsO family NAD(P)H-dependent flavin-containing monooxygenase [Frigoriflavimonas asaccharolytica]NRS93691.1 cation diffusion facilitator CzcD-associated flavoprotein CzcO [Frigoriflavimonas asaccharolytica]